MPMAQIVAPSAPSPPIYIGKGFRGANGLEFNIFGHPLPNYLTSELANSGLTNPYQIVNSTTIFDMSGLPVNSEVIAFLYVSPNAIRTATTYIVNWYRSRDNTLVFTWSYTLPHPGEGLAYLPGLSLGYWIGWLAEDVKVGTYPLYKEIQENGIYRVTIQASGGESFYYSANFAVIGIPPSLVLSNRTSSGFDWMVRVSNYFDTSNYIRAGICSQPFTNGQNYEPGGVLSSTYAPSNNAACVAAGTLSGASSVPSIVYGFAQAANGLYYQAGSYTALSNFSWFFPKVAGGDFKVTAEEWNEFLVRINAFQTYKGVTPYGFLTVNKNGLVLSFHYNTVRRAIQEMNPPIPVPNAVGYGDIVKASDFNGLVNSLNSIL